MEARLSLALAQHASDSCSQPAAVWLLPMPPLPLKVPTHCRWWRPLTLSLTAMPAITHDYSLPPSTLQVVEASDVIIEVLDARDPLGCRCADVERFVRRTDPSKKIILLLNKIGGLLGIVAVVFLPDTHR